MTALITTPGVYFNVPNSDYHRNPNLLPGHSLSSSGAKRINDQSPFHFWAGSPMNPQRPEERDEETKATRIGKAAHDMVLLPLEWGDRYFILPDGFNEAHTTKFRLAIAERNAALTSGMSILSHGEFETVKGIAAAIGGNSGAMSALSAGVPEVTLVWQDEETGVWLRARPDWLPNTILKDVSGAPRIVSDLKFMDPRSCSPKGWAQAVAEYGYHQSAAFYDDGIKAVFGRGADAHIFLPVEKEYPYSVSIYQLPPADLERGRAQNRIAIRKFADCLSRGTSAEHWPAYTPDVQMVGLPGGYRHVIDTHGGRNEAALIDAVEGE